MTKVLIAGTFDIIHPGHINLIKQARKLGDFLIATIARDQNVIKNKGRAPYYNEQQRLDNFICLGLADKVILGDLHNPYKMIADERPDIVALGYDQQIYVNGLSDLISHISSTFKIIRLGAFKEDFCKGRNIRNAIEDNQAGFLFINKEQDWTSHDVVAKLRSITKIKQIGHAGTLDPFATGLLVCAISGATKMIGMFDILPKTYIAKIKLGLSSDTYDRTGEIKNNNQKYFKNLHQANSELKNVLDSFIGKQEQLPPMYSAKKVDGKKLYELARKGIEIERKPSNVEIYGIKLIGFNGNILDIEVKCSAGTYIRSLAHDLGQKLGTGAVLWELNRAAIGDFNIEAAAKLAAFNRQDWRKYIIEPKECLHKINNAYTSIA